MLGSHVPCVGLGGNTNKKVNKSKLCRTGGGACCLQLCRNMSLHAGLGVSEACSPCQGQLGGLGHGKKRGDASQHSSATQGGRALLCRARCQQQRAGETGSSRQALGPQTHSSGRPMTRIVSRAQTGTSWGHPEGLGWGEAQQCQGGGWGWRGQGGWMGSLGGQRGCPFTVPAWLAPREFLVGSGKCMKAESCHPGRTRVGRLQEGGEDSLMNGNPLWAVARAAT